MIHILSRAVIIHDRKILLTYDPNDPDCTFNLPGGHLEERETALDALKREIKEEIGLTSFTIERFLGCIEHIFDKEALCTCHEHEYSFFFLVSAEALSSTVIPEQIEQHVRFIWMDIDHLRNIKLLTPTLPQALDSWLAKSGRNPFLTFSDSSFKIKQLRKSVKNA